MFRLTIIFCFSILLCQTVSAQENASNVEMNADEFKSLVSKLVKTKRNTMTYKQYILYRQIQHYKKIRKQKRFANNKFTNPTPSISQPAIAANDPRIAKIESMLTDIQQEQKRRSKQKTSTNNTISENDLEKLRTAIIEEMDEIKSELNQPQSSEKIVIKAPESDEANTELYAQLANNMNAMNASLQKLESNDLEKQLKQMQRSIEQMESKMVGSKSMDISVPNYDKELREIKAMIAKLETQSSSHSREVIQTNTISNNTQLNYLNNIIKGQEISQIQFANASHALTTDAKNTIKSTANLLNQHGKIDLLIAGYTSAKGSPLYNQNLSLQRTEAVKRYLMELGIHATRIFSEYHGIDYNAADDSNARRVEIKLLVRK